MENKITIRQWVENFNKGFYLSPDFTTQTSAGWYDWFCKDTSLAAKTRKIGAVLTKITNPFILDNYYVWFKNNCPIGPLYDDFRLEPIDQSKREKLYILVSMNEKRAGKEYFHIYLPFHSNDCFKAVNTVKQLVKAIDEAVVEINK